MKSGYWLAKMGSYNGEVNAGDEEMWRYTWGLDGPPKLRHFIWSACKGNLAVRERLVYRHIADEASCPVCEASCESTIHTLFECEAAAMIWQQCSLRNCLSDAPTSSFAERWVWLARKHNAKDLRTIATLLWAAWRCCNMFVFENVRPNSVMVASGYTRLVEEYCEYSKKVLKPVGNATATGSASAWVRPPVRVVKINTDAHVPQGGKVGLGVVIRDENGTLLACGVRKIEATSPDIAESLAVRYGMQLGRRLGYTKIWVESDAANVVQAVLDTSKGSSPIHLVFEDIKKDSLTFTSCNFSHVRRACNTVAHLVARWDTNSSSERVCIGSFPQSILALAEIDLI